MEPVDTIRSELIQTRKQKGYTQASLALACDCDATTICHIERGRVQPSVELLAKLSEKLALTPTELLSMLNVWPPHRNGSAVLHEPRERRRRRK